MQYAYAAFAGILRPIPATVAVTAAFEHAASVRAERDRRWPMILRKFAALRRRNRRSIRIVDANCGTGELLLSATRHARALGFTAIEARGVDADPQNIAKARRAGAIAPDPAVGVEFEVGDASAALREEAEFPADLLLYADEDRDDDGIARLAIAAGMTVLATAERPHGGLMR